MAMKIEENKLEIYVPNSEAAICAQHNGIVDRTVGSYYMSEQSFQCASFLNDFNGRYLIDLPITLNNVSKILKRLDDLNWNSCFKENLEPQFNKIETLKWYINTKKIYLYEIPAPFINEKNKYLKFNNTDLIIDLIKTLTLGDIMKIVIEKFDNTYIIYLDDADKIDDYLYRKEFMKWMK